MTARGQAGEPAHGEVEGIGAAAFGDLVAGMEDALAFERILRQDREVLLVRDLDDETLDAILSAEPGERSKRLNYLTDDPATD